MDKIELQKQIDYIGLKLDNIRNQGFNYIKKNIKTFKILNNIYGKLLKLKGKGLIMKIELNISEEERIEICDYLDKKLKYFKDKGENFLMDNREEYIILVSILNHFRKVDEGEYER